MGRRTPDWNEDGSLTLNVWTPGLPGDGSGGRPVPVLVWFHGGGFTSGSGGWDWYDGRNLAAAGEIIVVTANYHFGALGYLYLPELGVENLGTQDQEAVLAWVKRNISRFGGDPGDITVGGQSAGAFSSACLAVSPASGPLVRRVITQSAPHRPAPAGRRGGGRARAALRRDPRPERQPGLAGRAAGGTGRPPAGRLRAAQR